MREEWETLEGVFPRPMEMLDKFYFLRTDPNDSTTPWNIQFYSTIDIMWPGGGRNAALAFRSAAWDQVDSSFQF